MTRSLLVLAAFLLPLSAQAQFTVTFDGADQLASHGFVTSGLYLHDVAGDTPSPYLGWTNSPVSGTGVTYNFNASDNPATIRRGDGGSFTFNAGFFTSLLASSEGMYFRGYTSLAAYQASRDMVVRRVWYLNDGTYYLSAGITSTAPTFVSLDWPDLVVLELGSTGGPKLDPLGISGDNFEGFAADNLQFAVVTTPEPTPLVLMVTGFVATIATRRRTTVQRGARPS